MAKTIEDLKQDLVNNVRKLLAVLGIWLAGWLGFSPSWIFISYVLYAVWNYLEETKKDKLKLLRAITCDEKELLYTLKVLPSWVCIPDVERAEWMNQIIEQMWPFISTMVSDILKNKVGPEIQKKRSLLSSFKFEEVDLGNRKVKKEKKRRRNFNRCEETIEEYKVANKNAKQAVARAKKEALKDLYDSLVKSEQGQIKAIRIAKQKDKESQDVYQSKRIKDARGEVVTEEKHIKERWRSYFEELMNVEDKREERFIAVRTETEVENISAKEVERAMSKMKKGKATGPDNIPVEAWKVLGRFGVDVLLTIFNTIMENEQMPEEWRNSTLIPIFRNKGDIQDCSNYRDIKLMSHTLKMWERVIERRLREKVVISDQQFGFMPGRSTADAIFALRQLFEKYREGQSELHSVFIDLEKAYDRVPRAEVWNCLRIKELEEKYIRLIQDMYECSKTIVKCSVGASLLASHEPLKIGGVRVYTKHVRPNEIIMDAEIIYAGDADLKVCLKGVSAGISDLQIRGTLRIEIKPLLSKPPLIGGITFYFIDSPDFNFDLTNLLNVLDIPGLSNIVKAVLREVLDSYIVLPNRITIPMGTIGDLDAIKYPLPQGALRVKILEATDLPAHDTNVFKKNSSDPYVISKVGSFQHRTKTIKETLKPKWSDESFYTFVDTLVGSQIHFQIYDEDKLGKDDILGRVDLDLPKLSHSADEDMWLPLKDCKSGRMHITCGWNDFSDDSSVLKNLKVSDGNQPVACLFIKLENGKNLPATNMKSDTSCSFVEITIGNKKVQSKTQRNTKNPVWEELHSFFVSNPQFQTVNFKVLDNNADGPLGITEFSISTLLSAPGMKIKQAFPLKNCFTNGEIYMAIELKALIPPLLTHTNDQH